MKRKQYNMDGVFFSVERDGEWRDICYSDMTPEERQTVKDLKAKQLGLYGRMMFWQRMADKMADILYETGVLFFDGEEAYEEYVKEKYREQA